MRHAQLCIALPMPGDPCWPAVRSSQATDRTRGRCKVICDGPLAETVNGTPVPQALLEAVARARDLDLAKPEQREQALTLLTDYVLLAQAAQQSNFFAEAKFRADVEAARLQGVGQCDAGQLQQQAPITDAVVKAEYDAQVARAGKFEYDFTQLLFDNEDDALKAEREIVAGKPFNASTTHGAARPSRPRRSRRVRQDQIRRKHWPRRWPN